MFNSVVPLEILSSIIDILAQTLPIDDLKKFSSTCSFFRDQCRKHIYAHVTLEEDGDLEVGQSTRYPTLLQFTTLISDFPAVASYIKRLTLIRPTDGGDDQEGLPEAFSKLINLSTLEIRLRSDFWAESLSECLQVLSQHDAFRHLILDDVALFPVNLLISLSHLQNLELIGVDLTEEEAWDDSLPPVHLRSLTISTINLDDFEDGETGTVLETRKPSGEFYINLSGLEALTFFTVDEETVDFITRLLQLQGVKSLKKLSFGIAAFDNDEEETFDYSTALQHWVLPHRDTLNTLELHSRIVKTQDDPFLGLCQILDLLEPQNVLTTLRIVVAIPIIQDEEGGLGEEWSRLGDVLTKPGWKDLKTVSLRVLSMNNALKESLGGLSDIFEPLFSKTFKFTFNVGWTSEDDPEPDGIRRLVSSLAHVAPSVPILPFVF